MQLINLICIFVPIVDRRLHRSNEIQKITMYKAYILNIKLNLICETVPMDIGSTL